MPGPGRGGFGRGVGHGRGFRGHRGHGPALFRGPLGVIGAVATGAAVARAVSRPPPRRRYGPPPVGYIYVVPAGAAAGATPRAVRAEEGSFIVSRIRITSFEQGAEGEVLYDVEVTMNDGYKYAVRRRYSQFDLLREQVARFLRHVTPPFPRKRSVRSAVVGLRVDLLEERRAMLQAWLQSLCTAAPSTPALRLPLYDFLQTATYYPPEDAVAVVTTSEAVASTSVPYATATAYAESVAPPLPPAVAPLGKPDPKADAWNVPVESREASDLKLAMAGPDSQGRLPADKAAEALRLGTGATSEDLRAVWELSDIDKDGMLDREEFAVAWYLAHQAAAGNKPPAVLPPEIVPPSKRAAAPRSAANPF